MSEQLNWQLSVKAAGGPVISATGTHQVYAYHKAQIVVDDGGGEKTLPLNLEGVSFLVIKSTSYRDANDEPLKYRVKSNGVDGVETVFAGPLFFLGEATVELLGNSVENITFKNETSNSVTIDVIAGFSTVPTP